MFAFVAIQKRTNEIQGITFRVSLAAGVADRFLELIANHLRGFALYFLSGCTSIDILHMAARQRRIKISIFQGFVILFV